MSMIRSIPSNNIYSLNLQPRHASQARILLNPSIRTQKHGFSFSANRLMQLQSLVIGSRMPSKLHATMDNNILPGGPPTPNFPFWAKWILQLITSLVLPYWKLKGGLLLRIGNEVEKAVEVVEDVVEVVEDVAEAVEKVASEVADNLPSDGMLKDVAEWVEDTSKEVAEDARLASDFFRKVDEFKDEVEKKVEKLAKETLTNPKEEVVKEA